MIKVYVSHSIRGKNGDQATEVQMLENCERAIQFGKLLRLNFPKVIWYVPADHDEFVRLTYQGKILTEEQILEVDCKILAGCNGLLVYSPDGYISKGMQIEIDYATVHKIAGCSVEWQDWGSIERFLEKLENE